MVKFKPGDTIAVYDPIVYGVGKDMKKVVCDYCMNMNVLQFSTEPGLRLKTCSKCRKMFYCDRICQTSDWKAFHKYENCDHPELQVVEITCDGARYEFRTSFAASCGLIKNFTMPDGTVRRAADVSLNDNYRKMLILFPQLIAKPPDLRSKNENELIGSILEANSFKIGLSIRDTPAVGMAMYLELSGFDHSCLPNAVAVTYGTKLHIRAIKNIDTDLSPITINYLDTGENPDIDIDLYPSKLKKFYNVICNCQLCVNPKTRQLGVELADLFRLMRSNLEKDEEENTGGRILDNSRLSMEAIQLSKKIFGNYHPMTLETMEIAVTEHGGIDVPQPIGLLNDLIDCARLICGERHDFVVVKEGLIQYNPKPGTPYTLRMGDEYGKVIPTTMLHLTAICKHLRVGEKV